MSSSDLERTQTGSPSSSTGRSLPTCPTFTSSLEQGPREQQRRDRNPAVLGGRLDVRSTVGAGFTFVAELPRPAVPGLARACVSGRGARGSRPGYVPEPVARGNIRRPPESWLTRRGSTTE